MRAQEYLRTPDRESRRVTQLKAAHGTGRGEDSAGAWAETSRRPRRRCRGNKKVRPLPAQPPDECGWHHEV